MVPEHVIAMVSSGEGCSGEIGCLSLSPPSKLRPGSAWYRRSGVLLALFNLLESKFINTHRYPHKTVTVNTARTVEGIRMRTRALAKVVFPSCYCFSLLNRDR